MPDSLEQFADRTKSRARDVLLSQLAALRPKIDDQAASEILTDALATDILETAWRYQFDDDRQESRNKVHEIIEIAIEDKEVDAAEAADAATSP